MRNADVGLRVCDHDLRGDPAGPENWYFTFLDNRRIAVFGFHDVVDADSGRIAEVNGGAMCQREAARHFDRPDCVRRLERAHGTDHAAFKGAGLGRLDIGLIGRHGAAEIEMAQR